MQARVVAIIERHFEASLADAQAVEIGRLLDEAQAEQRRLEAENHALRERLKVPHPDRDCVSECNDLLRAKDERLRALEVECAALRVALRTSRHDVDCHPSEGRHSADCLKRKAALAGTAGRDLLAELDRLREALVVADEQLKVAADRSEKWKAIVAAVRFAAERTGQVAVVTGIDRRVQEII